MHTQVIREHADLQLYEKIVSVSLLFLSVAANLSTILSKSRDDTMSFSIDQM